MVDGGSARQAGGPIDGTDLDAVVGVGRAKEVLILAHGLAVGGLTRGGGEGEGRWVLVKLWRSVRVRTPPITRWERTDPIALSVGC